MSEIIITIGVCIFAMAIFGYFRIERSKKKLIKVDSNRPKLTRSEYIDMLVNKGFEKKHVEVVHDEIKSFIGIKNFSIYPEDDIHELYGIWGLDDIELIDRICKKLNIRKAEQKDCTPLNEKFDKTNAEYILTLTKSLSD